MNNAELIDAVLSGEIEVDENGDAIDAADAKAGAPETGDAVSDGSEVEAPIASKSGSYTIPYDQLVKARDRAKQFESEAVDAKKTIDELQRKLDELTAVKDNASAGVAGEADVSLFGDFSEEGIAKGIAEMQRRAREELRSELLAEIEPIRRREQEVAADAHYAAIYAAHADADEVVQSEQFAKWIETLPGFVRAGVDRAMSDGSAKQVIEVLSSFKSDASQTTGTPEPEAKRRVPHSLSEIAGEPHQDVVQQALGKAHSPSALLDAMAGLSTEQIDRVLNASM